MERIRLGKSEMTVTRIGFGGIPIQRLSDGAAVAVIRHALDLGVDWIDTAHGYGPSEERVGTAISTRERDAVKIFTKGPAREPAEIKEQFELSLARLRTDHVDLYQFHNVRSPEVWDRMRRNGTVDYVRRMRDAGRIRHIGASAHTEDAAMAVLEHEEIEVIQWPFNFIVQGDGTAVLDRARERDVGFIAMKPFGGGVLDDASVCIRFFHQFADVVLDPGFESKAQVEEVVGLCRVESPLSEADRRTILALRRELGRGFCRRCGYCMPCPQEVDIITLMNMGSFIRRFPPEKILAGSQARAVESHERCSDCGECEEKCPYELPIRRRMIGAVEDFEALRRGYETPAV